MRKLLLFCLFFIPCTLQAQEFNRYMVFFTDKQDNRFTLDNPEEFLSPRALSRRERQHIPLTLADLPVSQAYVSAVEEKEAVVYYRSRWFNAVLVEASATAAAALENLPQVEEVVYIAPGIKLGARIKKHDSSPKKAFRLQFTPPASIQNDLLGVPQLQMEGFTGVGALVAVFDGGFTATDELPYFSHLFEGGQLLSRHDFTTKTANIFRYSSHGTKALSTIAAIDSTTFIGTAPRAQFLLAVTEDASTEYLIEEYNWLLAAEWADSAGVDVISSSLGYNTFDDPSMNYTYEDMDGETTVSARAVQLASERGILVVTSAGNEGLGSWRHIVTPADAEHVISVGAIDEEQQLAGWSSVGPTPDGRIKPEVVALGVGVTVAHQAGGFTRGNGTSFAAPQVAGFAASLWQAYPQLNNLQLRELILESGNQSADPDAQYGWGVPYYPRIKSLLRPTKELLIYPNPVFEGLLFIQFSQSAATKAQASLYTLTGRQLLEKKELTRLYSSGATFSLSLTGLQTGIYFLHIFHNDQQYVHKIMKY